MSHALVRVRVELGLVRARVTARVSVALMGASNVAKLRGTCLYAWLG